MKISDVGIGLIKGYEGFSAKAYLCPAGKITIGYGHTGDELRMTDVVTRDRAEEILKMDLKWVEDAINKNVEVPLKQNQFDALCSFVYNVGAGAFAKSTMLQLINRGQYDEVPTQLLRWTRAGGKVMAGLVRRRQAEADLWMFSLENSHPTPQIVDAPDGGKNPSFLQRIFKR